MTSLRGKTGVSSGGSKTPGVVEGDALYNALYASRAQHHSRDDSALHALRQLPTIASALSHHRERIPDDVSTRSDVDACSRASRAKKELSGAMERLKLQIKSKKYFVRQRYTIMAKNYWEWYRQQKGNSWKEFDSWMTKNYLLNVMQPLKEIETVKKAWIKFRENLEKQIKNWKNKWHVTVYADQKPAAHQIIKFEFKISNKF